MIALGTYTLKAKQFMTDGTMTVVGYGSRGHGRAPDRPCTRSDITVMQLVGGQIARLRRRTNLLISFEVASGA